MPRQQQIARRSIRAGRRRDADGIRLNEIIQHREIGSRLEAAPDDAAVRSMSAWRIAHDRVRTDAQPTVDTPAFGATSNGRQSRASL